ncbi:hypothetical protein BGZ95_001064 [Linnemannia exigua]|uniref:PPPDE domain-containing protein n=2 Tax=Linnemannia TaxID=2779861 RepID=A0AAD4D7Y7_9FUNG|nr:hypothetical protein BGZ95_001064 [Linnemannia exigua]
MPSSTPTRRTPVYVNIYDMIPSNVLTSIGYFMGIGVFHSGVEILDKEFNFGGHEYNFTGVFCVEPKVGPPGVVFKETTLVGFTTKTDQEINQVIQTLSKEFTGDSYTLLTRNCNHFSSEMAYRLTGSRPPAWINRAAKLGTMFPCVVPQGWVEPPSAEDEEMVRDRETLLPRQ